MSELEQQALPETDSAEDLRQRIASQIGEDPRKLRTEKQIATFLKRMQEGVIISLHIAGTRRFWKSLTAEDLGLADKGSHVFGEAARQVLTNSFRLGKLSLLPSEKQLAKLPESEREHYVSMEEIETFERSARYCLANHAFKSHWGWFVPVTKYEEWKKENAKYEEQFNILKNRLLDNFDAIVAEVIQEYRPFAEDAWRNITVHKPLRRPSGTDETISSEELAEIATLFSTQTGRVGFVNNYLDTIREAFAKIGSRDAVERWFQYEVERSIIPLPSLVAKDLEETDRLYAERIIHEDQVQAELERIAAERRINEARAWNEEQAQRDLRYLMLQAERDRIQQQAAMERDIIQEARDRHQDLLRGFHRDIVGPLNDALQADCQSALESIEHNEDTLRGPVSRKLRSLVKEIEGFNFMGDSGIEAMLAQLRAVLPTDDEREKAAKGIAKIDTTRLKTALRAIHQQAKAVVIDLGMTPSIRRAREDAPIATDGLIKAETRKQRTGEILSKPAEEGTPRTRRTHTAIS